MNYIDTAVAIFGFQQSLHYICNKKPLSDVALKIKTFEIYLQKKVSKKTWIMATQVVWENLPYALIILSAAGLEPKQTDNSSVVSAKIALVSSLSSVIWFVRAVTKRLWNDTNREEARPDMETKIPRRFHKDPLLRSFTCFITKMPICEIVYDPDGVTCYEKDEILRHLIISPFSPATKRLLSPFELVPAPGRQALITYRIECLKNKEKENNGTNNSK